MPLATVGKCFRDRDDCESYDVIESMPPNVTERQMETLDYKPTSFVCCGCIKPEARRPAQDAYRICFKSAGGSDDISDNDEQDLVHLIKVTTTALAVIAAKRVSRGHIDVPGAIDGDEMMVVDTKQGSEERGNDPVPAHKVVTSSFNLADNRPATNTPRKTPKGVPRRQSCNWLEAMVAKDKQNRSALK